MYCGFDIVMWTRELYDLSCNISVTRVFNWYVDLYEFINGKNMTHLSQNEICMYITSS